MNSITVQFTEKQLLDLGRKMESNGFQTLEDLLYAATIRFMNEDSEK